MCVCVGHLSKHAGTKGYSDDPDTKMSLKININGSDLRPSPAMSSKFSASQMFETPALQQTALLHTKHWMVESTVALECNKLGSQLASSIS